MGLFSTDPAEQHEKMIHKGGSEACVEQNGGKLIAGQRSAQHAASK